jgi:hypothetical protein
LSAILFVHPDDLKAIKTLLTGGVASHPHSKERNNGKVNAANVEVLEGENSEANDSSPSVSVGKFERVSFTGWLS